MTVDFIEKRSVKESPLKREVQAVKSILQGGSSSMRDHSQSHQDSQHSSRDVHHRPAKDDKAKLKKRNLLEVFKKPSNAKEIGKPVKQRTSSHAIDKFELECIEILKVCVNFLAYFCNRKKNHILFLLRTHSAHENSGQCKKGAHLFDSNARKCD